MVAVSNYYHFSGEAGFKAMNVHLGWAKNPMIQRVPDLPPDLPVTFICGEDSWIDSVIAYQVKHVHRKTDIHVSTTFIALALNHEQRIALSLKMT